MTKSCRSEQAKKFLKTFNPDLQTRVIGEETRCIDSKSSPTLTRLCINYGKETAISWLIAQLTAISEASGARWKLSSEIARQTAFLILAQYFWLKVSELILFFGKIRSGEYERFFDSVDSISIMRSLNSFVGYRNKIIDRLEQEKLAEKYAREKETAISYAEYKKLKEIENGK